MGFIQCSAKSFSMSPIAGDVHCRSLMAKSIKMNESLNSDISRLQLSLGSMHTYLCVYLNTWHAGRLQIRLYLYKYAFAGIRYCLQQLIPSNANSCHWQHGTEVLSVSLHACPWHPKMLCWTLRCDCHGDICLLQALHFRKVFLLLWVADWWNNHIWLEVYECLNCKYWELVFSWSSKRTPTSLSTFQLGWYLLRAPKISNRW